MTDERNNPMERRTITCPETALREDIELERTPCGVVISGCSRFQPHGAVECTRVCAVGLDRRDRRDVDDIAPRVLVVYAPNTQPIAQILAEHLVRDGLTAELADGDAGAIPPPADYEAVVIGSMGSRSTIEYVATYRDELAAMPTFLFSDGSQRDVDRAIRETGWRPTHSMVFDPKTALAGWARVRDFALLIGEEVPTPELVVRMRPPRQE